MPVTKIPKKIVTVIEPKRSMIVDKEKYQQKRVAAYCRVSTDSEEQLTSYTTQKKVYSEMIAANKEWCFAGLYADEGISGTRADKRPEFKKMINDCLPVRSTTLLQSQFLDLLGTLLTALTM